MGSTLQQPQLNLRDARYRRPVMTIDAAKGILDMGEDELVELVEVQGALIGWNIATPKTDRREIRLLSASVAAYQQQNPDASPWYQCGISPEAAVAAVLPRHDKPWFLGTEIQRALNCGSTHVINLIETRCLKVLPRTDWRRGPKGSPLIARESFAGFLTGRLL